MTSLAVDESWARALKSRLQSSHWRLV